jgi:hypothetical protein
MMDEPKKINMKEISLEIEKLKAKNPDTTYIDCVITLCDKYQIEVESATTILSKRIKELIKAECVEINLIKSDTHKLL